MKMTKQAKFAVAIVVQLTIILGMIFFKAVVLTSGTGVVLKIEPIEPRDPLRGDYLTFQYNISHLDYRLFGKDRVRAGDTVYVILRRGRKYWVARRAQKTKPIADNQVFIKGKVVSGEQESWVGAIPWQRLGGARVRVIYGIEEYYLPEGKARGFSFRGREVVAKVFVDESGNALLKQIYVDGKPWP